LLQVVYKTIKRKKQLTTTWVQKQYDQYPTNPALHAVDIPDIPKNLKIIPANDGIAGVLHP